MADIKTVTIGSTVYDIKDATAREEISDVKSSSASCLHIYKNAWTMGAIGGNGGPTASTTRIRDLSAEAPIGKKGDFVIVFSPYSVRLCAYNSATPATSSFVGFNSNGFESGIIEIPSSFVGKKIITLIRNDDKPSTSIETELSTIGNYVKYIRTEGSILNGKKLSVMGDSISALAGYIPTGNDYYYSGSTHGITSVDQMWWQVVCRETGMERCVINAYSGSGVTALEDSAHINKVPMSNAARCSALSEAGSNPDVIIVLGGVNDYYYAESSKAEPATWDGTTAPTDGVSFTEQYAIMINQIRTNYPNAFIACCSIPFSKRGTDNGFTYTHTVGNNTYTREDYSRAIENVCHQMGVMFIDLSCIGFNKYNYYDNFASDDETTATHPNAQGHFIIGHYISEQLINAVPFVMNAYLA